MEHMETMLARNWKNDCWWFRQQRQTVVSQFFQLDRLVVEGGKSVCTRMRPLRECGIDFDHRESSLGIEMTYLDKRIQGEKLSWYSRSDIWLTSDRLDWYCLDDYGCGHRKSDEVMIFGSAQMYLYMEFHCILLSFGEAILYQVIQGKIASQP